MQYLSQLQFPHKFSETITANDMTTIISWLLDHAIALEYSDNGTWSN